MIDAFRVVLGSWRVSGGFPMADWWLGLELDAAHKMV
jgi:hypothetical protein